LQSVIARFWQLQWLLVCFVEFVDEDAAEASERGGHGRPRRGHSCAGRGRSCLGP
jgi:hypothetical protein